MKKLLKGFKNGRKQSKLATVISTKNRNSELGSLETQNNKFVWSKQTKKSRSDEAGKFDFLSYECWFLLR